MINLILSWFSFIIFIIFFQELTQLQYFLYSSCMFCFTCFYNFIYFVKVSPKIIFLVFSIPNIIFYYIVFVYNDFLSLTPMKYESFISLLIFYLFILVFIIRTSRNKKLRDLLFVITRRYFYGFCRGCLCILPTRFSHAANISRFY